MLWRKKAVISTICLHNCTSYRTIFGSEETFFLFIVFLHSSEFSCAISHNRDYNAIWLHTAESLLEIQEKYLNVNPLHLIE